MPYRPSKIPENSEEKEKECESGVDKLLSAYDHHYILSVVEKSNYPELGELAICLIDVNFGIEFKCLV